MKWWRSEKGSEHGHMRMEWPQIVMMILMGGNIGIALAKDGEPRDGEHSFIVTVIGAAIEAVILWAGGFWS